MSLFKLFSLPVVALRETLRCLSPIELILFSKCSARAAQKIKLIPPKHFNLDICLTQNALKINDDIIRPPENNDNAKFRLYIQHVCNLFNCPVNALSSYRGVQRDHFISMIRFIADRQKVIQILAVTARDLTMEDIKYVLENIKVRALFVDSISPYDFSSLEFDCEAIEWFQSSWFTVQQLLAMKNAIYIELKDSSLTNQDMQLIFQKWKLGELPKLEYLSIKSSSLDADLKIEGVEKLEETENPINHSKKIYFEFKNINAPVEVQRDDGVTAKLRYDISEKTFKLML